MNDFEEMDFVLDSWTSTGKKKIKKKSKKGKDEQKHKRSPSTNTNEIIRKKNKSSKFKDVIKAKKDKKKKRKQLDVDGNFIFAPDHLIKDSEKKIKRKKRVAFNVSPVRHPESVSSSVQLCREHMLLEKEPLTGWSQGQPQDNDSQWTGDNINSQDLFITQKTFRESPSDPSSGETSDIAVITTPQALKQRNKKRHMSVEQIKCHRGSDVDSVPKKANKQVWLPQIAQLSVPEEEEELHTANRNPNKEELSVKTQAGITGERDALCLNLQKPIAENMPLDVTETKSKAFPCFVRAPLTATVCTQTENFFTTELSSYLRFCQKVKMSVSCEDLKPLDLSMHHRACHLSAKVSMTAVKNDERCDEQKRSCLSGEIEGDISFCSSCSSTAKEAEVKRETCSGQPCAVNAKRKGEPIERPQSQSESGSPEMTTSSKDKPPCRSSKVDLSQVRAVQTRLNESFFFKTKGDGQSPRPESPLMKLTQGREKPSRKSH